MNKYKNQMGWKAVKNRHKLADRNAYENSGLVNARVNVWGN